MEKLHIYSEQCGGLWLELLALNMCHLPLLETLILNCWEDSKLCCPCDIDDVLPDIVERAGRLKTLFLGSGVQPSLNGLRGIFACPTLRVVDCYLCATSENDKVVEQLIQILSGSSVEIMRTKVSLLTTAVAQTLQQMTNNVNSAETPKRKKWNAVELKWDTSDDLVITSNLTGDQLFRARKIPLNVPISRLKQLIPNFGRSPDPGLVCCEIPQLCGPQGPAFSCGGCISGPEIPSCDTQRCMSVNSLVHPQIKCLAARTEDIEPAPCCSEVCTSDPKWAPNCVIGCLKSSCRPSPKRLGKIIWIGWEDADLDNHYTNLARLLQMPNDAEKPTVKKHHWLQFICTEELVYKWRV